MQQRLTQAGAWTSLPGELEHHILVITLGAHVRSSWRLILQDVTWLHALGVRPVLVQGVSLALLGEPRAGLEDLRTTLCGQVNQELLTLACGLGERAVALSGIDGQTVRAHAASPNQGSIGQVHAVNPHLIEVLCAQGYVPIIAPLGQGPEGTTLLIDADHFAAHLACALDAEILVALDSAPGVQRPDGSLIGELDAGEGRRLLEAGAIGDEQVPRVSACLGALVAVPRVHIAGGDESHALLHICLQGQPKGTRLVRLPDPASLFWRLSPAQDAAETPHTP
jgi:acetylglutamate kinase